MLNCNHEESHPHSHYCDQQLKLLSPTPELPILLWNQILDTANLYSILSRNNTINFSEPARFRLIIPNEDTIQCEIRRGYKYDHAIWDSIYDIFILDDDLVFYLGDVAKPDTMSNGIAQKLTYVPFPDLDTPQYTLQEINEVLIAEEAGMRFLTSTAKGIYVGWTHETPPGRVYDVLKSAITGYLYAYEKIASKKFKKEVCELSNDETDQLQEVLPFTIILNPHWQPGNMY